MAETLITDQVCGACGSEVREHSLFCYHCGGALEAENGSDDSPSSAWFRGEITDNKEVEVERKIIEPHQNRKNAQKEEVEGLDSELVKNNSDEILENKEETPQINVISAKPFKEKVKKKRRRRKTKLKAIDTDIETDKEIESQENVAETKVKEKIAEKEIVEAKVEELKTSHPDTSKLKSASAIRKRTKPSRIKKVEIVWEERESSPNIWFIIGTLILSGIVAALVFLAFYLK